MKTGKIEELFKEHATAYYDCGCDAECCDCEPDRRMYLGNFTHAINQAELEWYKKLSMRLELILDDANTIYELVYYRDEIRNKTKDMENER